MASTEHPDRPGAGSGPAGAGPLDEGGDAACWVHLVCPECGAVTTGPHREGCTSARDPGAEGPPSGLA